MIDTRIIGAIFLLIVVLGGLIAWYVASRNKSKVASVIRRLGAVAPTNEQLGSICKPGEGDMKAGVDALAAYTAYITELTALLTEIKTIDVRTLPINQATEMYELIQKVSSALDIINNQVKTCSEWCQAPDTATWDKTAFACTCKPGYNTPTTDTGRVVCSLTTAMSSAKGVIEKLATNLTTIQPRIKAASISIYDKTCLGQFIRVMGDPTTVFQVSGIEVYGDGGVRIPILAITSSSPLPDVQKMKTEVLTYEYDIKGGLLIDLGSDKLVSMIKIYYRTSSNNILKMTLQDSRMSSKYSQAIVAVGTDSLVGANYMVTYSAIYPRCE